MRRGVTFFVYKQRVIAMKKSLFFFTASVLALGAAAPVSAADLAAAPVYSKAPPMVSAIYDWSGLYIGLNGGGGWSRVDANRYIIPGDRYSDDLKTNGGTFGGQVGYRWQLSNWVFGIEGQGNWADFSGTVAQDRSSPEDLGPGGVEYDRTRTNSFGLLTGQAGFAWNNVLLYVKGGAAVVNNKYDVRTVDAGGLVGTAWANETRWGGTVGVGMDFGFAPNWSVGLEWNHIFLSGQDNTWSAAIADGTTSTQTMHTGRQDVDMALVRLNYRFGGPVIARY